MPTVVVETELEDRPLLTGLRRLQGRLRDTDRDADRLKNGLRNIGRTGGQAFGILARGATATLGAVTALGVGLGTLVIQTANNAEELDRWHRITGLQVRELDALSRAANRAGLDVDVFTEAQIAAVDKAQAAILQGGDALIDFQREYNLDALEFVRLNPQAQIVAMAQAVTGIENPTLRAAVASALWGDEAVRLLPELQDLAELGVAGFTRRAEQSGTLLDRQSATTLLRARNAWLGLRERISAAGTALAVTFAPSVTAGLNAINRLIDGDGDNNGLSKVNSLLTNINNSVVNFFGGTGEDVEITVGVRKSSSFDNIVSSISTALGTIESLFADDLVVTINIEALKSLPDNARQAILDAGAEFDATTGASLST